VVERLRELGVQYAQGYHYHQPEALDAQSLRKALDQSGETTA
jgi:EAL domain-containing protein (putative c-di-GMP-specific phosphodiesterase class I)